MAASSRGDTLLLTRVQRGACILQPLSVSSRDSSLVILRTRCGPSSSSGMLCFVTAPVRVVAAHILSLANSEVPAL